MDPSSTPQQPNVVPPSVPPTGLPPQPPTNPMPPSPESVPPTPPQPQLLPQQPVAPTQQVAPAPMPTPAMGGYPPAGQPTYPAAQVTSAPGAPKSKLKKIGAGIGTLIVVIGVGLVLFNFLSGIMLSGKPESKVGVSYIKAVQSKDYNAIDETVVPEYKKFADRVVKITNGTVKKDAVYKQILVDDFAAIPSGDSVKAVSVKVSSDGGAKHAVVVYSIGSNYVTALELYDSAGKPHVVIVEKDKRTLSTSQFKSQYDTFTSDLKYANELLDMAETNLQASNQQSSGVDFPQLFSN